VVEGILGKGRLEEREGRCGGVWCRKAFLLGCMRDGMTAVRSIVRVASGFPVWLDALGIGGWSIICGMCVAINGVYACTKAFECVYAWYVRRVKGK
jgi:hypothetical protein